MDIILHHLCVAVFKVRSSCFFVPRLDVEDVSPAVAPPLPLLPPSNVESSARSMKSMLRMPVAKFGAKFLWGRRRGGDKISMGEAGGLQTMIFVNAGCAPQSGAGLRPTTVLLTSGRGPTINFLG